jgi:hypothetical protein
MTICKLGGSVCAQNQFHANIGGTTGTCDDDVIAHRAEACQIGLLVRQPRIQMRQDLPSC